MKKRFLSLLALALVSVMALVGCGGGSTSSGAAPSEAASPTAAEDTPADESTTPETTGSGGGNLKLYWWGNQTRNDMTKSAADLYMEQNPGIKIDVEFTDWAGYWDKMAAMAAGGNLPDVIQMDYSYLNQYQQSNQLANLSPFIDDGTIDTANIPESILASGVVGGNCYALSLGSNATSMIYNKAITDEAGVTIPLRVTIEELLEAGNIIYEKTGVKTFFDGGMNQQQIIARKNGSRIFEELQAGDATSTVEHFNIVELFAKAPSALEPEIIAEKNPDMIETHPIVDGTVWNSFFLSNQYIALLGATNADLAFAMSPVPAGTTTESMYLKPSMLFSMAETSQNKEEAAKFINWFTNSEECNAITLGERGVPINTEMADYVKGLVGAEYAPTYDYIAAVSEIAAPIDPPDPAGRGEISDLNKTYVESVRYGDLTGQEAGEQLTADAQKILTEAAQ